MLATKILWQE